MAENTPTYYQSRHTGEEIDDLLDQSIAATAAANASAKKANDAAENANQEAAKIPGMVSGKADLDSDTGYVPSSQIAPLQGRQTGVKTGGGCFFSDDAQLLIDGNKTFSVVFSHNEYTKGAIHLLFSDHDYSTLSKGIYLYTIDDYVYLIFCGKYLLNDKIETGKVYQVVVTVDRQSEAVGYLNSIARNRTSDFTAYTAPTGFSLGGLKTGQLKYPGIILGARLFNYALTASEVATLWNGGEPERYMLPRDMFHPDPIFPTQTYTPSKGTWAANQPSEMSITQNVAAENGFSGNFQRAEAAEGKIVSLYNAFLVNTASAKSLSNVITLEYRSNAACRVVADNQTLITLEPNEGNAKKVLFTTPETTTPFIFSNSTGGYIELRTLSVEPLRCVAEYIAAGLLADKWRDTSGAGLDLPYVPTATDGTAVLVYDQPSGDSDAFNVLAASDCSLEARVTTLEQTLAAALSGDAVIPALQVRELGVWGSNNLILTGSGAPTKAPDRAGQLYIDIASGAVYKSTGNAAVSDWKNL